MPLYLYASETLTSENKGLIEDVEKRERRILRKIYGPRYDEEHKTYKNVSNNKLYENVERMSDTFRRRRTRFYGHIKRMSNDRLTKKIVNNFDNTVLRLL